MADIETTPLTDAGNQVVGKVSILYGTVKAMAPDGTVRVLDVNSVIYAEDQIITESDGSVSIILDDPAQSHLDIGRMSHVIVDADVYGGATPEDVSQASAEIQEIQDALLAGDETVDVDMEATAAGGAASAGGGLTVYTVEATAEEGQVHVGAETEGYEEGTVDTIPGVNEEPVAPEPEPEPEPAPEPPPDNLPDIGPEGGTVFESALPDGSGGGSTETSGEFDITSDDGIAAVRVGGVDVTGGGVVVGDYGTLTVTVTDGVYNWTYTLDDNTLDHDEQGNDTVLDTFALEVEDPDGDVAANTLTVTVVDDLPEGSIDYVDDQVEATVDETNDADNTADPFSIGTPLGVDTTTLVTTSGIDYNADGPGTTDISLAITGGDGADSGLDTTDGTSIFLYDNNGVIEGRVGGETGDVAFALSVDNSGQVTVAQYESLWHPTPGGSYDEPVDLAGKINAVVTVTDGDGDVATDNVAIGDYISFEDDGPVVIAPDALHIIDGGEGSENLNFIPGVDGIGGVEFNADSLIGQAVTDTEGHTLSLNGQTLFLHYGDDGADKTVLVAETADGDIGFTIDLDPSTNTYSIDTNPIISNGTEVTPTNLSGVGGGNVVWKALIDVGGTIRMS
jgi:hypothetical protein